MKRTHRSFALLAAGVLCLGWQDLAKAERGLKLELDTTRLSAAASEAVEVKLDKGLLQLGSRFLSSDKADEAQAKALVEDLESIYVWSFEFDKAGQDTRKEAEQVRKQLGKEWTPLVNVRSKEDGDTQIFAAMKDNQMVGMVILVVEPREFTVVNIVGPMDMARLGMLEGSFGIPNLSVAGDAAKPAPPAPPAPTTAAPAPPAAPAARTR